MTNPGFGPSGTPREEDASRVEDAPRVEETPRVEDAPQVKDVPCEPGVPAHRSLSLATLLVGVIALLNLQRFSHWSHALDDAWISFRTARSWLETGKLTFDTAYAPVEGMTNLLWTLLSALWIALFPMLDPIVPARLLGGLCHLVTVVLLVRLAVRLVVTLERSDGVSQELDPSGVARGRSVLEARALGAGCVAGGLVALSGSMAYHAVSGLETALYGLLFVAALERLESATRGTRGAAVLCGVLLGLLGMCRPEGVAVGGLVCFGLLLWPEQRRSLLRVAAPFGVMLIGLEAFRWHTYGALVPNTFQAKSPDLEAGLQYLGRYVLMGLGFIGPLAAIPAVRRVPLARLIALVAVASLVGTTWSGGDWMVGYRRFTLEMLSFTLLAGIGVGVSRGWMRWLAMLSVTAMGLASIGAAVLEKDRNVYNTRVFAQLGHVAALTPGVQQVALTDIGSFGWHFKGSILDLAGLTDRHIARLPGSHGGKGWDEAYFRQRRPDLVLVLNTGEVKDPLEQNLQVRTFDRGVLMSMLRQGGYRYHGSIPYLFRDHLLIFAREGLILPEAQWGKPAPRDLRELYREYLARKQPDKGP